jgi:hypothetical protein
MAVARLLNSAGVPLIALVVRYPMPVIIRSIHLRRPGHLQSIAPEQLLRFLLLLAVAAVVLGAVVAVALAA